MLLGLLTPIWSAGFGDNFILLSAYSYFHNEKVLFIFKAFEKFLIHNYNFLN